MASTLTIQYDLRNYPQPPTVGVVGRVDGTTTLVRLVELHEPVSVAQMQRIASHLVQLWLEPELHTDDDQALVSYLESVGTVQM